jgi:lipopolysaccharide/colanic/teichoic acid biosynthesis glycosyltransferase
MYLLIKRIIDIIISLAILLLASPILLIIMILIKLENSGPIFYRQQRVGKNGHLFVALKFRTTYINDVVKRKQNEFLLTIVNQAYRHMFEIEDDPRVTRVGRFLRQTYLDEFPQFLNVLKGDMSLVGPRPALTFEVKHYTDSQRERFLYKPGLTGLSQISINEDMSFDKIIETDINYGRQGSLLLDMKILWETILFPLKRKSAH